TLAIGAERLRLHGLDAPEVRQTCTDRQGRDWRCGEEARAVLERLTSAASVMCRGSERDRYNRLLVACRDGELDVNAHMVALGLAVASGNYASEEAQAQKKGEGLWAGEFERPRDWRVRHGVMD